jgi:dynein heavy chain
METLDKFSNDVDAAVANMNDSIKLQPCTFDLSAYKDPSEYQNAAHHPEISAGLEQLVTEWCKQVEKVLAESEQMRKEADDIGPNAELAHWKARLIKFNSINDQLRSPTCQKVVGILIASKSKGIIKTWRDLENRVADAANESKVSQPLFIFLGQC